MIKSVNAWSYEGGLEGTLNPFDLIQLAKEDGFHAIELGIGPAGTAFGLDVSRETCESIATTAREAGVPVLSAASGLYWAKNLASETAEEREAAFHELTQMVRITRWLGASTLLVIPGAVDVFFMPERKVLPYDHVWEYATLGIKELVPLLQELRVTIGIENVWNKFLLSPIEMATFIDQFDSPFVGSYLDVGNILPYGYPEQWINILDHRIKGVHFKDFRRSVGTAAGFVDLLEGDVDFSAVTEALRLIAYQGPVACEMIPRYATHPRIRVQNTSRAMDAILAY